MTTEMNPSSSLEEVSLPLNSMKSFIESSEHADWTVFNQSKKSFLELFKQVPNSPDKQKIWKQFVEISDSARAIRKLQEEEGQFAADMIAKALDAIEVEISNPMSIAFTHPLFDKVTSFKDVKSELISALSAFKYLNSKADQIQSLRDELTRTGMRLSVKGRLFDKLSLIGDKVFPVKKELGLKVIDLFNAGLEDFCQFASKQSDGSEILFQIRVIQSFLREMNLKKASYDQIKNTLDPLWKKAVILKDKKNLEQQEALAKSEALKKTFEESFATIKELAALNKDEEALKIYDSLLLKLKDKQILKPDYRALRGELEDVSQPLFDRIKMQNELKNAKVKEQASILDEKKQSLLTVLTDSLAIDEKKNALDELVSLNLNLDEFYRFNYTYYVALTAQAKTSEELEDIYFEIKKIQDALRSSLAASAMDFSLIMNLSDVHEDIKTLLSEIVKKVE